MVWSIIQAEGVVCGISRLRMNHALIHRRTLALSFCPHSASILEVDNKAALYELNWEKMLL